MKKISRNHILIGGIVLAAGAALFLYLRSQKCGVLKPLFKNQCFEPLTVDTMPTRTATDDWVQQYNRHITGYREKPTMVPENYYDLPFRYEGPEKGILTSDLPHPFFGGNPMNPEPNWHNNWIRQPFSF